MPAIDHDDGPNVGQVAEGAERRKGWDLVGVRFSFVAVVISHRRHRHF